MTDVDLAQELVDRLNRLLRDPGVSIALGLLIQMRVALPGPELLDHPTIQVGTNADTGNHLPPGACELGFLGMLNGIVGVIPESEGWGYITAHVENDRPDPSRKVVLSFSITKKGAMS